MCVHVCVSTHAHTHRTSQRFIEQVTEVHRAGSVQAHHSTYMDMYTAVVCQVGWDRIE